MHQPTTVQNNTIFALTAGPCSTFPSTCREPRRHGAAQIQLFDGTNTHSPGHLDQQLGKQLHAIINNSVPVAVSGNYQYRMVYPAGDPDYMVDRVYLAATAPETDIPEPATMACLAWP